MPKDIMRPWRKNGLQKDSGATGFLYGKHNIELNTLHKSNGNVEIHTLFFIYLFCFKWALGAEPNAGLELTTLRSKLELISRVRHFSLSLSAPPLLMLCLSLSLKHE